MTQERGVTMVTTNNKNVTVNNANVEEETKMVTTLTREQVENMGTMTMRKMIITLGYDTIEVKNGTEGKSTTEKYRNFLLSLIEIEADVQEDTEEQVNNHELINGKTAVTHEVVATDHAYYGEQFTAFEGNKEQCEEYAEANKGINEGGDANLVTYKVQEKIEVAVPSPVTPVTPVNAQQVASQTPVSAKASNEAKAKTDKLFALIKAKAADNDKKGFGYTISSFILQAVILEAGTGLKKLKGHTVTAEEEKLTWDIYKWLKSKDFIKPVVYSVKEDEKVRIFMPEYPGKTENTTVKMIPYNKSAGYTAKKATSFLVTIPGTPGAGK
jgi:hypothetical protein